MKRLTRPAVFAIPGDINTRTGGYIYEKELLLALRRAGRSVTHLPLPGSFPDPTRDDLATTGEAFAEIAPEIPVILDGFLPGACDPDVLALLRAPFVAVTHHPLALETGIAPDRARRLYATERANLARAAHVIVPSRHTRDTLVAEYDVPAGRITVVPPGTKRPQAPKYTDLLGSCRPPLILSVGQLVPRKGHDVLIAALARVRDLDWRCVIVGEAADPKHAASLHRLVAAEGLGDRVQLAGSLDEDALTGLYRESTLFALATRYEGYGMVFAEALAHGLPVVAAAGGAVPDTVPRQAGRLVPPDDVAAFANALREVLVDREIREGLAEAARRHGDALPDWDDAAAAANAILDGILT
jgi:glycosyltransferase involved in cell wall biosynthesis